MQWSRVLTLFMVMGTTACQVGNLSVYKIDIQQGNVMTRDQVSELKPGMTPTQVRFILGSPLVVDPFHPERWDYAYTYRPGTYARELKVPAVAHRDLVLIFKNGQLSTIQGADQIPEKATPTPFISGDSTGKDAGGHPAEAGHDGDAS